MKISTKRTQDRQPRARRSRIIGAAEKLGEWIVRGAASGAAREILRYPLELWDQT
ncbi:hypothetical protein [Streptomyces sp. NPDC002671]